jgi:hypothetical protein
VVTLTVLIDRSVRPILHMGQGGLRSTRSLDRPHPPCRSLSRKNDRTDRFQNRAGRALFPAIKPATEPASRTAEENLRPFTHRIPGE